MGRKSLDTNEMLESSDDFEAAYESHAQEIYRFLFWRTKDTALSEDLTSSVFEKAWKARGNFHGGSLKAWLYKIAHNTLTDHWRKKQAVFVEDTDTLDEASQASTIEQELDAEAALQDLRKALQKLPDDMRAIIELRFIEELSGKDVAQKLHLSESNVRVLQYRALRKLKDYLQ